MRSLAKYVGEVGVVEEPFPATPANLLSGTLKKSLDHLNHVEEEPHH